MHNWKCRREIHWATFCWRRENFFSSWLIILTKEWPLFWRSLLPQYGDSPHKSVLDWSRNQNNWTMMAGAHPRPQISVDERMFIALKFEQKPAILCKNNCQDDLYFTRNVDNSWCSRTAKTEANVILIIMW